jgi:hypothetical protein
MATSMTRRDSLRAKPLYRKADLEEKKKKNRILQTPFDPLDPACLKQLLVFSIKISIFCLS